MTAVFALLIYVALERAFELYLAQRNTKALLDAGGVEVGAGHYPAIVTIHTLWLLTLYLWALFGAATIDWIWAGVYIALQAGRFWVMASLGRYWTTRIITVPGAPLVRSGPYRVLKHPNYLVVALEIAVLPLAVGAWPVAILFSLLNGAVLWVRIRAENAALSAR
ncbi:MAG: isoprenylcysteine carboxylmethyltransferase family protein [Rhodospirillaceae bacterium]|nr:isoprenylcysteine carboxylmethyltransferase family protein [Rhodospirillaceae bacterium]